jgi:hypothetical protein
MSRNIEVIVESDGSLKIEAVGFHGADCVKATEFLEYSLGYVSSRNRKPEYCGSPLNSATH